VECPRGGWPEGLPPNLFPDMHEDEHHQWHELSTFRPYTGGPTIPEPPAEICPRHRMALPLTGVCDDCG